MSKRILLLVLILAGTLQAQWGHGAHFYWSKNGAAQKTDSIRFVQGTGATLTQSGNTLTIAATGTGTTPAGARANTGWTAQGGLLAVDTLVQRIEWGGQSNASFKIFDADNDTIMLRPQQNNGGFLYKDGSDALASIDTTGRITSGDSYSAAQTISLDGSKAAAYGGTQPELYIEGSDNDNWGLTINTSDQAVLIGASGGFLNRREQATDIDSLLLDPYGSVNGKAFRLSDAGTVLFAVDTTGRVTTASIDSNSVVDGSLDDSDYRAASVGATALAPTAVTAGSYTATNLTVDADGRITAASNGSAGTDYSTTVNWVEEFVGGTTTSGDIGDHGWTLYRENGTELNGFLPSGWSTNNWGEYYIAPNNPSSIAIYTAQQFRLFNNGYFEARVSVPSTAASEELFVGLGSVSTAFGTGTQGDAVGFIADIGTSANWIRSTCKDATRTETASSTAVSTGYHVLKFVVNDGQTSIEFFVDGVSIGSNTTNIPTGAADVMYILIGTRSSALGSTKADFVRVNFAVTR